MNNHKEANTSSLNDSNSLSSSPPNYSAVDVNSRSPNTGEATENEPLLSANGTPVKHLTKLKAFRFCFFWFGYSFSSFLFANIVIPGHVLQIVGKSKVGSGLATVNVSSGIVHLLSVMLIGELNDCFTSKYGKRSPFVVFAAIFFIFSYFIFMWPVYPLSVYALGNCFLILAATMGTIPFNAFMTEITPESQRSLVSSVLGINTIVGCLCAAGLGIFFEQLQTTGIYIVMAVVVLATAFVTSQQEELEINYSSHIKFEHLDVKKFFKKDMYSCLFYRDFRLLFFQRFFFQLAIATMNQFLQYWILDCTSSDIGGEQGVSLALIPLLLLSPFGAYLIPKSRRKIVVYFSATLMCISTLFMMLARTYWVTFFISAIFGIGYGPFISVEFAMLMDVMNDMPATSAAKNIAIWHSASVLPQLTGQPLSGIVRDFFQAYGNDLNIDCLGYEVVFGMTITYLLLGVLCTYLMRGIK
ncbi:hypothetical protein HDU92_005646 [Lobulomyces angularis]|nr:hypothetical protein HDU92_005646 [Lobulomyces angularis]